MELLNYLHHASHDMSISLSPVTKNSQFSHADQGAIRINPQPHSYFNDWPSTHHALLLHSFSRIKWLKQFYGKFKTEFMTYRWFASLAFCSWLWWCHFRTRIIGSWGWGLNTGWSSLTVIWNSIWQKCNSSQESIEDMKNWSFTCI